MQPTNYFSMTHSRTIFVTNIFLILCNLFFAVEHKDRMYFTISITFTSKSKAEK